MWTLRSKRLEIISVVMLMLLGVTSVIAQTSFGPADIEKAKRFIATKMTSEERAELKKIADRQGKSSEEVLLSIMGRRILGEPEENPNVPPKKK